MKKIFSLLLIVVSLLLVSCGGTKDYVVLPKLDNMSRVEIMEQLDKLDLHYYFRFEKREYSSSDEFDKFIRYGEDLEAYDKVALGSDIYVYTTALHLPTEFPEVTMDFDYEGKTYHEDGIEKVTLASSIDGDTAHFYTQDGEYMKVRYLGIDTPESTYEKEPWGKAASEYMKNLLYNAKEIVLEKGDGSKDTYGRYLAYVWVDGKLANLLMVQQGYSSSMIGVNSKYYEIFNETELLVMQTGRRVYGEIDPNYDYDNRKFTN